MALRDPFSSVSHIVGAGLAAGALVVLVLVADGAREVVAATIHGACLLALYTFSATYHAVHRPAGAVFWLRRLDHAGIYLLIAGTYTPVGLVLVGGAWGWAMLGTVWGAAAAGIVTTLTMSGGRRLHVAAYLLLGWIIVAFAPAVFPRLDAWDFVLVFGGGVAYTGGAAVYALDARQRQRGTSWGGAHEAWHVFVMLGSAAHVVFVARFLA